MSSANGSGTTGQPDIWVGPTGYLGWGEVRVCTDSALHIWIADLDRLWMCLHRARQTAFRPNGAITDKEK